MAVLQRVALYPNERYDTPDARAMEAFGQNDWRFFLSGFVSSKSYILSGFEITNYSNIFSNSGIKLRQNNAVIMHPEATTQAAGFYVASGSEADALLQLSPDATNFVEIDFETSSGSPDTRAFWDMGANGGAGAEYTDDVDTVINLELKVTSNVSGFTAGKIPLYKISTSPSGVALEVTDCRPLFFRLGTGGTSPTPENQFSWPTNAPDAGHSQLETPITSNGYTAFNAPFQGGDKNLKSFKDWMDAIMTSLMKLKGSPYWYSPAESVPATYQNSSMMLLVGGIWKHGTVDSQNYISDSGKLALEGGSTIYRLGKQHNPSLSPFPLLDMNTHRVLFIILPYDSGVTYGMGENDLTPVNPRVVTDVEHTQIVVSGNGNYILSGGVVLVRNQKFSYTNATYDSSTDKTTFNGISPDPSGLAKSGDYVYQAEDGVTGYYHYGQSETVPGLTGHVSEGVEKAMWLAFFDGTKMHTPNSELEQGEQIQVGDNTSQGVLNYIGSTGESDSNPVYGVNTVADGTNLTDAITEVCKVLEAPIYDEIVWDMAGTGWLPDDILTLPPNSRAVLGYQAEESGGVGIVVKTAINDSATIIPTGGAVYVVNAASNPIRVAPITNPSTQAFFGIAATTMAPSGLGSVIYGGTTDTVYDRRNQGIYTLNSGELEVYENGVLWREGANGDYVELSNKTIKVNRIVPPGSYIRFRIVSVGGAGAAAGNGLTGITMQAAYSNGRTITTLPSEPVEINGIYGEKLIKIHGDAEIDYLAQMGSAGFNLSEENPIQVGNVGIWVDSDTSRLQYTRPDGTILHVGDILENVGSDDFQMTRTMTNISTASIPAGSPVYIVSPGNIALAHCDSETAHKFFGIAAATIPAGQSGKIIYGGIAPGIFSGMGFNTGYIWLGSTPGSLQLVEPDNSGDYLMIIGLIDGEDLILQPQLNGKRL